MDIRKCITEQEDIELVIKVNATIDFALAIQHFRIDILSNPGVNSNFLMNCLSRAVIEDSGQILGVSFEKRALQRESQDLLTFL